MATTENTTAEKKMGKVAQIVCYLNETEEEDIREACDRLDDIHDFSAKESTETHSYRLVRNGVSKYLSEDEYEALQEAGVEDVRLIHYVDEDEQFEHRVGRFGRRLRRDVIGDVDMASGIPEAEKFWGNKVKIGDDEVFAVEHQATKNMGLIKGGEVPDGESVWIDEDMEIPAVILRFEIDGVTPSQYRWFNDNVIPEVIEEIKEHEWVADKRTLSCDKEYSETGACYRL